jgi:adenylate cyclase
MFPRDLAQWLADSGLRNLPLEELVDGFSRRLNEAGVPVARVFVGMNTLHPLIRARSLIWDRATGPATHFEFQHTEIDRPILRMSPFTAMLRDRVAERRVRLHLPAGLDELPVFTELRAEGMTDWLGHAYPFGELIFKISGPDSPERMSQLGVVMSLTTDHPGGFTDAHLEAVHAVLPLFALAIKGLTIGALGQGLLETYLGVDPARRVMAGSVRRGEVSGVEAVLLYADLRSFTRFADALPGNELMALLDGCFACMVRPVGKHGGEVLKFLGDGLLAIFRIDERRRAEICASALAAASEALDLMDILAETRRAEGKDTPGLDIALHVGTVQYGNVGTDARLDFTVIGPAVNEAARIEVLCKELGQPLLMSAAFADSATSSRPHLVSLGHHALRGVREKTELFGLA